MNPYNWKGWKNIITKHSLSPRKTRLFAVAAAYEVWDRLEPKHREITRVAENYEYTTPTTQRDNFFGILRSNWPIVYTGPHGSTAARAALWCCNDYNHPWFASHAAEAALTAARFNGKTAVRNLMKILSSFSHPISNPELKTSIATNLAHNIYNQKHFHLMPILADALQDAGCDDQALLTMLSHPKFPHRRGSNVLDFLTNRK